MENLSHKNPTMLGSDHLDGNPVLLRNGDIFTVIDRSFRFESNKDRLTRRSLHHLIKPVVSSEKSSNGSGKYQNKITYTVL